MSERDPSEGIFRIGAVTKSPVRSEHYARISYIRIETVANPSRFRLINYKVIYWKEFPSDLVKMGQYQSYIITEVGDGDGFSFMVNNEDISDFDLEELCIDHFMHDVLVKGKSDKYDVLATRLKYKQVNQKQWTLTVTQGRPAILLKNPLHTYTLQSAQGLPIQYLGGIVSINADGSRKTYTEPYGEGDWYERVQHLLARPADRIRCTLQVLPPPKPKHVRYARDKK